MPDTLDPRSAPGPRSRGTSHVDFKTATTSVAAKAVRNELDALITTVGDPATRKVGPFLVASPMLLIVVFRPLTRRCNLFSTSSIDILPNGPQPLICALFFWSLSPLFNRYPPQ